MTAKEQDFTLGEARRQLNALWSNLDSMKVEISDINEHLRKHGETMVAIEHTLKSISEGVDKVSSGSTLPHCIERGVHLDYMTKKLAECESELKKTKDDLATRFASINAEVDTLRQTNKVLKWILGFATAAITAVLGKVAWEMLYLAIKSAK